MTKYRGDTGLFRAALDAAGFVSNADTYDSRTIFNDNSKDQRRRRLKLWFAKTIFDAPSRGSGSSNVNSVPASVIASCRCTSYPAYAGTVAATPSASN